VDLPGRSTSELSEQDLIGLGFKDGKKSRMRFASGIELEGILKQQLRRNERNLVLTFDSCTVRQGDTMLFQPDWGVYDLACGGAVRSVFGGAADRSSYQKAAKEAQQKPGLPKTNLTEKNRELNQLYAQLRALRESARVPDSQAQIAAELSGIHARLEERYPNDWLLRLELLEMNAAFQLRSDWESKACARLDSIAQTHVETAKMIRRGLELI
jgi:phenylalanine-4-hydroxylase